MSSPILVQVLFNCLEIFNLHKNRFAYPISVIKLKKKEITKRLVKFIGIGENKLVSREKQRCMLSDNDFFDDITGGRRVAAEPDKLVTKVLIWSYTKKVRGYTLCIY